MKKTTVTIYAAFWLLSLCIEVLPYVPQWQNRYWLVAGCNLSLLALLFFSLAAVARALAAQLTAGAIYRRAAFWALVVLPMAYIGLAWCSDSFVLNQLPTKNFALYAAHRFKGALAYIAVPVLWSGVVAYKQAIILALQLRRKLQEQENAVIRERYRKMATDLKREVKNALNRVD